MAKLVIRDPFAEFGDLFDNAFGRAWADSFARLPGARPAVGAAGPAGMPVNIYDTEDGVGIEAWVPGFTQDELEVTFEDGQLTVRAEKQSERSDEAEGEGRRYRRREAAYQSLERSFHVGGDFDSEGISGDLRNGVLDLQLKRAQKSEPRRIPIAGE